MTQIPPNTSGKGLKIAIVTARFNEKITSQLTQDARATLIDSGVEPQNIVETTVPGAFEIPLIAKKFAMLRHFDAIIALGAVIKGETAHFEYVSNAAAEGVLQVALETGVPVIFGVLTTYTEEQAIERAFNFKIAREWAFTAIEMGNLSKAIVNTSPSSFHLLHPISL